MQTWFVRALMLLGVVWLSGCASSTISLSDFNREVTLAAAARLPTEAELNRQGRAKVVVFEADDSKLEKARRAQAATVLTRAVEDMLGANGVEVIDRSIATKLGQELQLAEVQGVAGYEGPALASFAVKPTITLAEYAVEYVPASSYTDKKGKVYNTPASYAHKAKVNVSLRVVEVPSLNAVKTLNGRGLDSYSTSDRGQHDIDVTMIRSATQNALSGVRNDFLNLFAPKGYVLGKREHSGKSIFRISIGSEQGIVAGNKVVIYSEQENIHPITKKVSYDKIPVIDGVVSNLVTASEAWVVPDDEKKSRQVRLGDRVEVVHKNSGWANFFRP
jgi:hypothetical protein